jgi:hypothetical protein
MTAECLDNAREAIPPWSTPLTGYGEDQDWSRRPRRDSSHIVATISPTVR